MRREDAQKMLALGAGGALKALEADACNLPEVLDCGDNSCRSPLRSRGGMRTNGGCRCSPIALATAHVSIALGILDQPSTTRYVRSEMTEEGP